MFSLIRHDDEGSMLPFILVFVLIVVVMIMGMMASTAAFLAQQELQSICDGAAAWAAASVEPDAISTATKKPEFLPISAETAKTAVIEYQTRFYARDTNDISLRMAVTSDAEQLAVACESRVKVPFGAAFGKGGGIHRETVSAIRSPLSSQAP